jgi:DNA ligase (NAD+)
MKNEKILKEYRNKINILVRHNNNYYIHNISKITDAEYDILKKEILELEKKHKFLNDHKLT